MTREEILALPVGRELDALIAEHVFGWRSPHQMLGTSAVDGLCMYAPDPNGGECWYPRYVGHFSTDIAAAWQVVEKLLEVLPSEDFHLEHLLHDGWAVGTCFREDWIRGETAPLSICRAALIIMLVEKGG